MRPWLDKVIDVIGVPMDLGANIQGANLGPKAVRAAGLHEAISSIGYRVSDEGDIKVVQRSKLDENAHKNKFRNEVGDACQALSERCYNALKKKHIPLSIGGDHSLAIGSISGVSRFYHERKEELGLMWFDAHADINTPESSPSGNIHGMPLSVVLGAGFPELCNIGFKGSKLKPKNVVLLGIRAVDEKERRLCKESGIRYYTMREIDERGMAPVMREAIALVSKDTAGIHLSFDLDGVDPTHAPGVSTPVAGGFSYREAHLALEMLADSGYLTAMDFVELNPRNDRNELTAKFLIELVLSALGKSII